MTFRIVARAGVVGSILFTTGCIPLTVGSTAKPVPVGTTVHSTSAYFVPNSFDDSIDHRSLPRYGVDYEVRFGFDDHSDIGVRVPSASGIVANYKRRLNGVSQAPGAATSIMVGGGIVNWGEHAKPPSSRQPQKTTASHHTAASARCRSSPSIEAPFTIPQHWADSSARGSALSQPGSLPKSESSTTTRLFTFTRETSSSFQRSQSTATSRAGCARRSLRP